MAAPTHVVDTYQINVGAGDASIHILALRNAQTPPAPNPGDRGQVVRAILIDGGQGGGIEEYLKKTIETIEERYTFPPPATSLQFDAVVVTHWDGDHYDGQVKLFAEDLRAQYLIEEAQVSDRLKNDPSLKPPEVDLKKLKCRYFKFDDTTQAPLTTFYCPTWDGDSDNGFDGILDVPNAQYKGHAGDYQLPNSQDRLMSIQCGAHIANVGVSVRERKKRKAAGKSDKSAIPNAEILHCPAQCVLHYGPAELLGRELFYGCEMAGKPHWSTVQSPVALLQTHQQQIALGRKPGLYCVAAQRQIMGKPARPLSGKDADSPKDVGLDPAHTLTNAMSIAMLVIHPSAPLTDPPKISLYTGGDGEGDIERRIKDFLNGYEVTVLKAGHHGSAAGTDLGFFEAIKPSAVVFSAGNDYGHPHWSKLAFMHAYYSANATTTLGGPVTPVWSTCYPSWFLEFADENDPSIDDIRLFNWALLKTEDGDKDVSAKAKTYKYVLDTLRDRYDFSNSLWPGRALAPLADIYREFVIWTKDQDLSTDVVARKVRAEARYWFSSQIWPSISSIQAIECSSSPALANGQKVSPVDRMRHLYIQHGKGRPVYDGTVTVEKGGVWNAPNTKSAVARANKDGNENHDAEELPPTKWDAVDDAAQKAAGRWPKRSNRGRRDKEGEGKKVDPLCYAVRNGTNQDLDEYLAEMQRLKDEAEEAREAWEAEEAERAKNKENDDEVLLFARRPTTIGPLLATPTADAPAPYTPRSVSVILSPGVAPDKDTLNTGRVAYISIQSPLFDFVNGLALQGIWLLHTAKLEGDNIQVNAQVTPRDATFDWLHSSVFAKKLEFVLFTHDENFSDEVQIAEGRITLEFPGQSDSDAWSLDFTTHSTAIASNFGGSLPDVEDTGSLTAFAGMLWAVPATTTSSTVPLVQVFKAFDIVRPLLTVGLGDVQLQLDMTPRTVSASSTLWPPNAIWLLPNDNSLTMLKLSFKEQGTGFLEQKFKEYIPGVTVSEVCFHMQRSCGRGPPTKDARFTLRVEHSVTITAHVAFPKMPAVGNIMAAVKIGDDFVTASLTWNSHEDPFGQVLQTLIDWLNARISSTNSEASKLENDNFSGWLSALGDGAAKSAVSLRRLTLKYSNRLQAFRVDLQVDISAGAPKGQKVPLMVYFTWERGLGKGRWNLTGEIWPKVKLPSELPPTHFHPDYDALQDLSLTGASYVYKLSLLHLDPATELKESDVPRGIPTEIVKGRLSITNDSVTIYADIQCLPLTKDVEVPCIALQGLQLNAVYHYGATKGFDLSLHGQVALAAYNASRTRTSDKTYLDVTLSHAAADQSWTMYASIMGVHMSALHKFFAPEERGAVMEFMDKFYLPFMQIEYKYVSGLPSRFTMLGQLVMGGMELDFEYTHLGSEWSFAAALGAAKREQLQERLQAGGKQSTTVRSLLSDIDAELLDYVPDLVADVSLDLQEELAVSVLIERQPSGADEKARLLFLVTVELKAGKLGSFHFTFAQLQAKASAAANAKAAKPLRMFKISLDSFDLSKIELDLVGKLEQPFESLDYVWASEDVDRQTMTFLNTEISRPRPKFTTGPLPSPFRFKDNMSTSDAKSVLCKAGSHFLLVMKRAGKSSVVADCMFGSAPPTTKPAAGVAKPSDNERALKGAGDLQEAPVNHSSSFGLSLTSIGMKMGNRVFHIVMTAKIKLGPIEVMLIGLDLKLDLTNAKSLRDWDRVGISASIQGLALEFNQPPVVLAGLFRKIDTNNFHGYGGGIDVGIAPYEFLAAGMYGEGDGPPKFTSVFVFARLNGPLIELEFAEINGICGGFGYNSALRLPEVSQVTQFPFLSSSAGTKPDPIDQLNAFTSVGSDAWITPSPGSLWFAAGLGIKAFQMVEIQAVITVGLGSNVQLGLVAEAVAKLPKGVKNDNEVFLLVDFVLAATLDFGAGKLAIAGELTPSSFVLHPSCHLTGGFALSYWFENSGHEGDWVFTIGGFHPQFAIPDHYPTAPPRLGISWRYDEHLYLLGEAYFAITPRECMAGFLLAARFEMDSLSAHFDAHADLLVNYEPFQFHGEAVVSVGVSYDLGFGALSKRINAEIGATVKFHGPPLAGTAHIDLEIFSVDINFGPAYQPKPPITLDMFWDMLAQHKDTSVFHLLHAESGQEASDNAKTTAQATEPWRVRGGQFSFRVQLRAVVNRARLVKDASSAADEVTTPAKPCARLLRRDGNTLVSSVKVTVSSKDGSVVPFRLPESVKKPMPIALWGEYNAFNDPDPSPTEVIAQVAAGGPSGPSHSQDATVEQIAALKILPPTAKLTGDIPSFNAMDAFQSDITTEDGKSPEIPAPKMSAAQQLVRDVSSPKQLEDVRTAWGTPDEKLGLNRHELLSLFTSLVSDTGDGKRAKRYAGLKMAPPKQLLAEMPDLYSAAPSLVDYGMPIPVHG